MALTDHQYKAVVLACAVLSVALILYLRFSGDFDLPKNSQQPNLEVDNAVLAVSKNEGARMEYQSQLARDASAFGLEPRSASEILMAFPFRADRERRILQVGETVSILGLALTLRVETPANTQNPQMVLSIKNTTHKAVAYRVGTMPSSGELACANKGKMAHNAIAIPASGEVKRIECDFKKGRSLAIERVEVMTISELSFFYLSALAVNSYWNARSMQGHAALSKESSCPSQVSANLKQEMKVGRVAWRDIVDYYARHSCQTFTFFAGYKAFEGEEPYRLPAQGRDR